MSKRSFSLIFQAEAPFAFYVIQFLIPDIHGKQIFKNSPHKARMNAEKWSDLCFVTPYFILSLFNKIDRLFRIKKETLRYAN